MLASRYSHGICQTCRNDLLNLLRHGFAEQGRQLRTVRPRRRLALRDAELSFRQPHNVRAYHSTSRRYALESNVGKSAGAQDDSTLNDATLDSSPESRDHVPEEGEDTAGIPDFDPTADARDRGLSIEAIVRSARQAHGEHLPPDTLTEEELLEYVRLYGEPAEVIEEEIEEEGDMDDSQMERDGAKQNQLLRSNEDGTLEEVEYSPLEEDPDFEQDPAMTEILDDSEDGFQPAHMDSDSFQMNAEEIARQLGGEVYTDEGGNVVEDSPTDQRRMHPLTVEGKWSATTRTVFLPKDSFTEPVSQILSGFSNKHIAEAANKLFGGPGLPGGVATPMSRRTIDQTPISINTMQHAMGEQEANAFIAALWPGIYSSVLSVLVEVRKRLGTDWLRKLMLKEGGPRVLDVGAGGAAIIAWREIIKAEWQAMYPDEPIENAPLGKATVLTGADALRHRSSVLLENTTFLPRLPDYVHVRDIETLDDDRPPLQRKQFDIILAPHSLWHMKEEFMRKAHVQNLWSLLSADGGILVLLEKGVPRGFEVLAGAREMILERFISSPGSETYEDTVQSQGDDRFVNKSPGMIVAPCTNHNACPMYTTPGVSAGRKDICAFEQRYIRPAYLQNILKAKHRNHEDLQFSYLAVQKGVDQRAASDLVQGSSATKSAFHGYDKAYDEEQKVNMLSLPRLIYTPLKRRGHVTMDVCTPEGNIERWTVPRSFSRQAYHDARKSGWGDLWALGAKTRIPRNIRLGEKKPKTKQQRLQDRKEERIARKEDERLEEELMKEAAGSTRDLNSLLDNDGSEVDDIVDEVYDDHEEGDSDSAFDLSQFDDEATAAKFLESLASQTNAPATSTTTTADRSSRKKSSNFSPLSSSPSIPSSSSEPIEPYGDAAEQNWLEWNKEFERASLVPSGNVQQNRSRGGGKEAKMRERAGAGKFSGGGMRRVREATGAAVGRGRNMARAGSATRTGR